MFVAVPPNIFQNTPVSTAQIETVLPEVYKNFSLAASTSTIPVVPFFSQFKDIASPTWQKVGCGVASLAMVINYFELDSVSVTTLLNRGIASGAYLKNAGWIHQGLIDLSKKYELDGKSFDLSKLDSKAALAAFEKNLKDGPVIASVHYKFEPTNPIPHLVVINAIENGIVYYNDPAAKTGGKTISTTDFLKSWKKKFIAIRPVQQVAKATSLTLHI
ncbi:MAG: C39 family peptidase [Patescibacteria group bacterium]